MYLAINVHGIAYGRTDCAAADTGCLEVPRPFDNIDWSAVQLCHEPFLGIVNTGV